MAVHPTWTILISDACRDLGCAQPFHLFRMHPSDLEIVRYSKLELEDRSALCPRLSSALSFLRSRTAFRGHPLIRNRGLCRVPGAARMARGHGPGIPGPQAPVPRRYPFRVA